MSRALLLIDERCTTCLNETVTRVGASHVTVVAVPRLPAFWRYAPLSGQVTVGALREEALAEAHRHACRVACALPDSCSVEHRVLTGWSEVIHLFQQDAFQVAVLAVRPGRRARRMITAAGLAAGTALACP
jgi:hypothetical protein